LQEYSSFKGNPDIELSTKDFKTWVFNIDGYDVQFYFNTVKTDYFDSDDNTIETLQVWSEDLYYLPFIVSFKVALAFFGKNNIILTQIITPNKFIYCWNKMYDNKGKSLSPNKKSCINKKFLSLNQKNELTNKILKINNIIQIFIEYNYSIKKLNYR